MYKIYGNVGCSRCAIVKGLFTSKGIDFTYENLTDLSEEDKNSLINKATEEGKMNLPLIVKEDKLYTLEEVK